jgi:hypothetical protein
LAPGLVPALALALASAPGPGPSPDGPTVEAVELHGVDAYGLDQVLKILRIRPPQVLRRSPQATASILETRYHDDGYPAALVAGAYDPESRRLVLTAQEGRLNETVFDGLSPRAARQAAATVALAPGRVLRDDDIRAAFDRLASASDGALGYGESRVEATPAGARLVLTPARSRARLAPLFGGGDLHPVYPWTRVDGLTIPLGGELTLFDLARYDHLRVYAAAFYATSAEKVRYVAGAARPFGPVTVGYEHHDLTDTDDLYRSFDVAGAHGTAIYFEAFANYFRRRGDEAYLFVRITKGAQLGVAFRSDRYDSLPVATGSSDPNVPITPGEMRSIVATVRIDPGGVFADGDVERRSFLQRSLYGTRERVRRHVRAEASFETTPGSGGGDFDFRRFIGDVRGCVGLGPRGALDTRVILGLSGGTLPVQKRFVLGGVGSLRGYPDRAFTGDRMVQATAEARVDAGRRLPRFLAFYDGGQAWDPGASGSWKSSVGVGVQWPASGAFFLRADFARPVGDADLTKVRSLFRLQIPF